VRSRIWMIGSTKLKLAARDIHWWCCYANSWKLWFNHTANYTS